MLYLFDDICARQSYVFSYATTRVLSSADKLCSVCGANQLFIISSKGEKTMTKFKVINEKAPFFFFRLNCPVPGI